MGAIANNAARKDNPLHRQRHLERCGDRPGYRSQHHVETAFRRMKDCHHIALRPQHHWTDQKVEVHVFCCVLALMLCSLLRRELHRKGIDRSIPDLLDELGNIREVGILYPPQEGKEVPTIQATLSQMSDEQRTLYEVLNLERYCSQSV
jgi:hypothetical protein